MSPGHNFFTRKKLLKITNTYIIDRNFLEKNYANIVKYNILY